MGVDLVCVNEVMSCSYTTWHSIRMIISHSVVKFMKQKRHFQDINDDTILGFDDYFELFFQHFEMLEEYGLEGSYFLLAIPDTTGIYNVENSVSVIRMMNIIHDYLPEDMPYYHNMIKLFQESIKEKRCIMVS